MLLVALKILWLFFNTSAKCNYVLKILADKCRVCVRHDVYRGRTLSCCLVQNCATSWMGRSAWHITMERSSVWHQSQHADACYLQCAVHCSGFHCGRCAVSNTTSQQKAATSSDGNYWHNECHCWCNFCVATAQNRVSTWSFTPPAQPCSL